MAGSGDPDKKNRSLAIGYAYLQMSALFLEWNNLSEALTYAREGIQICKLWGYSDYLYNGLSHLAMVLLANGDLDGSLSTIREAKQLFDKNKPVVDRLSALEAVINLARGDLQSASAWATMYSGLQFSDTLEIGHWIEYYHFSIVLIAQGKLQEAYGILERLGDIMEKTNSITPLLKTLAQRIIILHLMKEDEKALSLLQQLLGLAEPEGFIRVFTSKGAPMEQMLLKAAKAGLYPDFVNRLLQNFHEKSSTTTIAGIHPEIKALGKISDRPTMESLTNQELKVLHLLNTHLSIPEIAQEMFVSPSTIRTHVRNIYEKVGAHGRIEALEQAKVLGLL
jgi:LuxR family transcriptional regulator, maltose regulon positive regulatory protein